MGGWQPIDNKEQESKSMMNQQKKRKKKKIFRLPQDELDYYLSFQVRPVRQSLALRDPSTTAKVEKINERILVELEKMRQEYETKGYVTFEAEVTDDEEEEEDAAIGAAAPCVIAQGGEDAAVGAPALCVIAQEAEKEYDAAVDTATPWIPPQGRGRRRFRPGVVKQAGGVKKIII